MANKRGDQNNLNKIELQKIVKENDDIISNKTYSKTKQFSKTQEKEEKRTKP